MSIKVCRDCGEQRDCNNGVISNLCPECEIAFLERENLWVDPAGGVHYDNDEVWIDPAEIYK